jgi:hypothetical protein
MPEDAEKAAKSTSNFFRKPSNDTTMPLRIHREITVVHSCMARRRLSNPASEKATHLKQGLVLLRACMKPSDMFSIQLAISIRHIKLRMTSEQ